jgi:hypothetical protein
MAKVVSTTIGAEHRSERSSGPDWSDHRARVAAALDAPGLSGLVPVQENGSDYLGSASAAGTI